MTALGIEITDREAPTTWANVRPTHNRQPVALYRLRKAAEDAWNENTRLADLIEHGIAVDVDDLDQALDVALAADKNYQAAYESYWANPAQWWADEDAADEQANRDTCRGL